MFRGLILRLFFRQYSVTKIRKIITTAHCVISAPTAAIQTSEFGVQTRFVNKDQTTNIPTGLLAPPEGPCPLNVGAVLFGGARRVFYNSNPNGADDATGQ